MDHILKCPFSTNLPLHIVNPLPLQLRPLRIRFHIATLGPLSQELLIKLGLDNQVHDLGCAGPDGDQAYIAQKTHSFSVTLFQAFDYLFSITFMFILLIMDYQYMVPRASLEFFDPQPVVDTFRTRYTLRFPFSIAVDTHQGQSLRLPCKRRYDH